MSRTNINDVRERALSGAAMTDSARIAFALIYVGDAIREAAPDSNATALAQMAAELCGISESIDNLHTGLTN